MHELASMRVMPTVAYTRVAGGMVLWIGLVVSSTLGLRRVGGITKHPQGILPEIQRWGSQNSEGSLDHLSTKSLRGGPMY